MKLAPAAAGIKDASHGSLASANSPSAYGARFRAGNLLAYVLSFLLTGSAIAKFIPVPKVAGQMALVGFAGGRLTFIAALEIASAFLFAYPRTRFFGLLMVSAYLGGAISAHVGHGQIGWQPAVILGLVWLSACLRRRDLQRHSN
jgi:DoxX-like family